jgi:hypothetical protein
MTNNFTTESIISSCLNEEFKNNNIKYLKYFKDKLQIHDGEILLKFHDHSIEIIKHKISNDNEWRLHSTLDLILNTIKEYNLQLNCYVIININDGVICGEKFTRLSTVGRHKDSTHVGIPDSLSWSYINNGTFKKILSEDINFSDKKDIIVFRGADTGKVRDNLLNQRVYFCNKYHDYDKLDAKITKLIGYNKDFLQSHNIQSINIISDPLSTQDQLKYKYILYIYGNSVSTDRLLWNLASNSITIQVEPLPCEYDYIWYHHFLLQQNLIPSLSENNFIEDFNNLLTNTNLSELKIKQQNFANILIDKKINIQYTKEVLVKYNTIYNS